MTGLELLSARRHRVEIGEVVEDDAQYRRCLFGILALLAETWDDGYPWRLHGIPEHPRS